MAANIWSADILKAREQFMAHGYALFSNALPDCGIYSARMMLAVKEGQCNLDPQCPLSPARYGLFDDILLKLKPVIEGISGLSLYPTYSYARVYSPGEVLEKHTDRPSCEISCTLTLSYEGDDIWPIYFSEQAVKIPVGSLVAYRGLDLLHWRDAYVEGRQQVQVFLHYVNAAGIYADHIFDKRRVLNV